MQKQVVAFDFETTWSDDRSIRTFGARNYALHVETEVLLCGVADGKSNYCRQPQDIPWEKYDGWTWVAHNFSFEMWVFCRLKKDGILPEHVRPKNTFCTADMCAYLGLPRSLDGAVKKTEGVQLDKGVRDALKDKSYQEVFCPAQPELFAEFDTFADDLTKYCAEDAKYTYKLWEKFHDQWPTEEQRASKLNRAMMCRGISYDPELVKKSKLLLQDQLCDICEHLPWLKSVGRYGKVPKPTSTKAINAECAKINIPAPPSTKKDDKELKEWFYEYQDRAPFVKAVLDHRSVSKQIAFLDSLKNRTENKRVYFNIRYCGTHTGRVSGEGGFNMLNLAKGENYGVDVRKIFVPKKGCKYVIADFSNIEGVIGAHVVGLHEVVKRFEAGEDFYEIGARDFLGYKGPSPLKKHDPVFRNFCKVFGLGAQYGAGAKRLYDISGIERTEANFNRLKNGIIAFRTTYNNFPKYWKKLEQPFYKNTSGSLKTRLPSGRFLHYNDVTLDEEFNNFLGKNVKVIRAKAGGRPNSTRWWGGSLFENLIQAIARDIMVNARLNLAKAGFTEVLEVYDEVVIETDKPNAVEEVTEIMERRAPWAKDIPLRVEAQLADHYKK